MKHVALLKSKAQQPGGLEKAASRIAQSFVERGNQVTLLTTGMCKNYTHNIHVIPFQTVSWPPFLKLEQFDAQVTKWIEKEKPEIIFGMDRNRFQTHIRAGNGVHLAYLRSRIYAEGRWKYLTCLINPMHRKILEIEKQAFLHPRLQKIIANSYMVRNELIEYYNVDEKKIVVIHNGVEWDEMAAPFSLKKKQNKFQFLFVGNGYLRKGLKILLEALSKIQKHDFSLTIVGKDNNLDWFKNYCYQIGLQKKVRFCGAVDNMIPFYQEADALVIPSFYDPFANVTVEALAMGLFVISSKQNGGHEVLNQENGMVIEDLLEQESVIFALKSAMERNFSKEAIRKSVAHLDFSNQLNQLMLACE